MSDFNLMNFLIDKEDRKLKQDDIMDPMSMWNYGSGAMLGDDFLSFDNFLKMDDEDPVVDFSLFEKAPLVDESVCSDSGVSCTLSPPHLFDEEASKSTPTPSELNYAPTPTQSVQSDDVDMSDTSSMDTILLNVAQPDSDSSPPKLTLPAAKKSSTSVSHAKSNAKLGKKKSTGQTYAPAPPSILIPVNLPGLKTIKVVNASGKPLTSETLDEISSKTGLGGSQLKFLSTGLQVSSAAQSISTGLQVSTGMQVSSAAQNISTGLQVSSSAQISTGLQVSSPAQSISTSTSCTDDEDYEEEDDPLEDDDRDSIYPKLELTYEERRLMEKEGVRLPSHYPLTKLEERELKRIRRKIRNKISAQDSRKRKKEYVDGLEERVKKCTEVNVSLLKRIKQLEARNHTLCSQLRKIQTLLTNKSKLKSRLSNATPGANNSATPPGAVPLLSSTQVQSSTCLMVLCLSLALILAPNLQNGGSISADTMGEALSELSLPASLEKNVQHPTSGRSRSLLFAQYALGAPQHHAKPSVNPLNADLVEQAYAQLLASHPPAPDDPQQGRWQSRASGAKQGRAAAGLGGLLADLGELLNFKPTVVVKEEEAEVIEIKEEVEEYDVDSATCRQNSEPDLEILYNDHNYGKPMARKRAGNAFHIADYAPARKKPALDLEPLISLLAAAKESFATNAQGPRILDSPVDDFAPKYVRASSLNFVSSSSADIGTRQGSYNHSSRRFVEENYIEVE